LAARRDGDRELPTEPFSYRRRIAFGECDPARIYYAPRAVDYAVEAVEAWYESVLGITWADLVVRHGLEATFARVDCEYLRPLVAGQTIQVRLRVVGTDATKIHFRMSGEGDSGDPYFQASLVACLVERNHVTPVPVPPGIRDRIETYRSQCGEGAAVPAGGHRRDDLPGRAGGGLDRDGTKRLRLHREGPAGAVPFTRQRRVVYGECGPSGTIYPPKVFEFAIEAIGEWYEEVPGITWLDLVSVRKQGAPFVSVACEYLRPMVPGQRITLVVRVTRLGRASIGFAVEGYDADGAPSFDARLAACFIDQEKGFRSIPIPEEFYGRIQAYRAACEAGG
jgi:acyl-CoA thioesterase FadM